MSFFCKTRECVRKEVGGHDEILDRFMVDFFLFLLEGEELSGVYQHIILTFFLLVAFSLFFFFFWSNTTQYLFKKTCTHHSATVFTLGLAGIICSIYAAKTCEFISFHNGAGVPWKDLQPPFQQAVAANVGIFQYQVTISGSGGTTNRGCTPYPDKFAGMSHNYPSLVAAQVCAIIAPIMAGFAMIANLFECCTCNFPGSFVVGSFLFLIATGIQAGTFSMIAEPSICFQKNANQNCHQEKGVYLSASATVLFFLAGIIICCLPRNDPVCLTRLGGRDRKRPVDDDDDDDRRRRRLPPPIRRRRAPPQQQQQPPTIIIQPIIIQNDAPEQKTTTQKSSPPPVPPQPPTTTTSPKKKPKAVPVSPKKKKKKAPKQLPNELHDELVIRDEEFQDNRPPPASAARVETKEKSYPDGRRVLEEITYHKNGKKSVKETTYHRDGSVSVKNY